MKGGRQERGKKSHIDEEIDVCIEEKDDIDFSDFESDVPNNINNVDSGMALNHYDTRWTKQQEEEASSVGKWKNYPESQLAMLKQELQNKNVDERAFEI